jgi:hypothetical protein
VSQLDDVQARFERAGVPVEREVGYLVLRAGADTFHVRVMPDPGHPERVHLRSVTPAGEVTVSTQRMGKLKSLVDYARVLQQAAARQK